MTISNAEDLGARVRATCRRRATQLRSDVELTAKDRGHIAALLDELYRSYDHEAQARFKAWLGNAPEGTCPCCQCNPATEDLSDDDH
jgi:hypothetical protein